MHPGDDLRVLIVAPVGRDAPALASLLGERGIATDVCNGLDACSAELIRGAGALLITQEGLADDPALLLEVLDGQPSWSALPVIALTDGDAGERRELLARLGIATGVVTLLERPVRQASLVSATQAALSTRRRQYDVRELLNDRDRRERQLRDQAARLRASEARFREMADAAPAMIWVTDRHNTCTFLSRGWYEFTGQAEGARVGHRWQRPVHPDDRAGALEVLEEATRRHEPCKREYRLRTAEGGYRWVLDAARPWLTHDGGFLGFIGSVIDIHELRLAEQEKQRSHALLDAVMDALPVGVVIADAGGRLLRWNRAHESMWGLAGARPSDTPDMAAYAGWKGWWSGTDEAVRPHEWSMSRALMEGEGVSGVLVDIEPFDGSRRRTTMNASAPVRDPDGNIIAGVVAQVDVTEVMEMERALRDSEEKFRTLADNIAQLAWMADSMGHRFWFNQRWFDYTGTTLDEVEGWGWRCVHHPDHVDRVVEKIGRCFRNGEVWEDLFPLRSKHGDYRWFLSRAVPVRDAAGRVTRWFGTNTDVTEQQRAEEALREADRRKDEFLATLAHELRNPLAPIRTSVELLRLEGSNPETLARCRDIIDRQVGDLTRLVEDLLEVSRITRGKVHLRKETVALDDIVRRAVEASQPLADAGRHTISVKLPDQTLWLRADPTRLTQVLTNLLNNAAAYTPEGGRIEIHACATDGRATVSVRDTGVGISREHLSRIFEMFSQARPLLDRPGAGLGIGLSLAKGLVELHGGTISAASDGDGRGSTFTVTLPLARGRQATGSRAAPAAAMREGLRILVVDDNRDAADGLARVLELMGHASSVAYDGPEALAAAEREPPDAILLDIGLPTMSGYAVARAIRSRPWGRDVLLVAQTGWGKDQDKQRAREAGFDHHLVKPLEAAHLQRLLTEIA